MELKTVSKDRQDIDLAAFTYNDAKYIRKEIQVNNEELYYLYIYMNVFSKDKKELEYSLNKIEGLCQAKGIITKRAYFRQEEAFISCSPCMENKNILKQVSRRNILTNGLIATYPFISSSIFDEEGIFIGTSIYNNSLIFIDRYNKEKYKNANMCIFGTSGAGKSYYTKLMILRYRLFGIYQYIIDPDREYENLCKALKGTIIKIGPSFNTYINIFDIREDSIEDKGKGFLATKIPKLIAFFNLIFGEMNEEEKGILEEKIIYVYKKKGITFDDNTLYKKEKNKNKTKLIFKRSKDMPILEDLFNLLEKENITKKFKIKLIPFVKGSLKFFNQYTNIEIENKLIVADVYDLGEENIKNEINRKIKINNNIKKQIKTECKVISVLGSNGVGKSIYSVCMSNYLNNKKNKILIIDFDILNNSIHTILGISKYNKKKNNKRIINDCIINVDNNISVLTGENIIKKYKKNINYIVKLLEILKEKYDYIIIDTSAECFFDINKTIINKSDINIFLLEANLLEITKATKLLEIYNKNWNIDERKIKIVINKYNKNAISMNIIKKLFSDYEIIGKLEMSNIYNNIINKNNKIIFKNYKNNNEYKKINEKIIKVDFKNSKIKNLINSYLKR